AIHTNLDNIRSGVNKKISDRLGLHNARILKPNPSNPEDGIGMVGELPSPLSKNAFLQLIKQRFDCGGIRFSDAEIGTIAKVAVCGGSGSFLTREAMKVGADAFVTADITYHKFFDNEGKMLLLDIGHYESEQYTSLLIKDYLSDFFPNFAVHLSEIYTNPVRYF
ncbi:MAG: Nif3-like dinuclear metal center hexameric protein, partial [Bacteroidota bacterium]